MLTRTVEPELMDFLPPANPQAVEARRSLVRVNRLLRHPQHFLQGWNQLQAGQWVRRVIELGAGDGKFLLLVLARLPRPALPSKVVLVDRLEVVEPQTCADFRALGWEVEVVVGEASEWLESAPAEPATLVMANLFLHHFTLEQLRRLFARIALHARAFLACEPRRSGFALAASRFLGLAGCNYVSRYDGILSVRAGFAGSELSRLWPDPAWRLQEGKFGLFSHGFSALRP